MTEIKETENTESIEKNNSFKDIKPHNGTNTDEARNVIISQFKHYNIERIDGEKYRVDDNGNPYAKYNKETGAYDKLPNNKYTLNSYSYETNKNGQITEAIAKPLRKTDRDYKKTINDNVKDMKKADEKGHIFGDIFNGANDIGNLIAMDGKLNKGEYKKLEMTLKKAIEAGCDVAMKVNFEYPNSKTQRPSKIKVTYEIDGVKQVKVFFNTPSGGSK